eukprot:COSAG02_NODE_640_length_19049_cov_44.268738_8_plen_110_part_00
MFSTGAGVYRVVLGVLSSAISAVMYRIVGKGQRFVGTMEPLNCDSFGGSEGGADTRTKTPPSSTRRAYKTSSCINMYASMYCLYNPEHVNVMSMSARCSRICSLRCVVQ